MKAVIPTAGVGKRLRPFTHSIPKVLLQVADKPILGHIVDDLTNVGVGDFTFVVGYLGEMIEDYIRNAYPNLSVHFVSQDSPLGLGHAVHLTESTVMRDGEEPLLILLGDTLIDADLGVIRHSETDLIGVRAVEEPRRYGVVELDTDGRISAMIEKPENPRSNLAIVGVYYFREPSRLYQALRDVIDEKILTQGEIQLTDALQRMLEQGVAMRALPVSCWYDCGRPETLLQTNHDLLERRFTGAAAEIAARYPTVVIKPPVYIAPSATVEDSVIGPYVTIADGCCVKRSIIERSIINEGGEIQNARLTGSIIGNRARLRENTLSLYVGDQSEVKFE
jgi:glucose-1-phosphate thymidylyltransferase